MLSARPNTDCTTDFTTLTIVSTALSTDSITLITSCTKPLTLLTTSCTVAMTSPMNPVISLKKSPISDKENGSRSDTVGSVPNDFV